jgi:uncharacterized protein YdaU (DUF1376 family)
MNRAPAFQFYANDWLSSTHIALMTPAQEGAYIRLLCYAWNDPDCSIPDDDQILAALSRLGEGWFNGGSSILRKCFEPHPEKQHRLINKRLTEERIKQDEWRKKSQEGGLKSGESRRSKRLKGGSRVVGRVVEPNTNQTRTLHTSYKSTVEDKSSTGADAPRRSRSRKQTERKPDDYYRIFTQAFQAKYNEPYSRKDADFIHLGNLKKTHNGQLSETDWQTAVKNYFDTPLSSHTLADLSTRCPTFKLSALDRFNKPITAPASSEPAPRKLVV